MNSYQMTAEAYKEAVEREPERFTGEALTDIRNKIAAFEFLGSVDKDTRLEVFNSGVFNDVCRGFLLMTLDRIGADEDTRKEAAEEIGRCFDEVTASEAERYFIEH